MPAPTAEKPAEPASTLIGIALYYYPRQYLASVREYIAADPLRPLRAAARASERAHAGDSMGVLHIIHRHGGEITVESREREGTCFTVRLPA